MASTTNLKSITVVDYGRITYIHPATLLQNCLIISQSAAFY